MDNNSITYQCAPSTTWAVEMYGVLLLNKETSDSCFLKYPQAAIWDLMTQNYSYAQVVSMLCAIASLQDDNAERLIVESLEQWVRSGFLTKGRHHGESFDYK